MQQWKSKNWELVETWGSQSIWPHQIFHKKARKVPTRRNKTCFRSESQRKNTYQSESFCSSWEAKATLLKESLYVSVVWFFCRSKEIIITDYLQKAQINVYWFDVFCSFLIWIVRMIETWQLCSSSEGKRYSVKEMFMSVVWLKHFNRIIIIGHCPKTKISLYLFVFFFLLFNQFWRF